MKMERKYIRSVAGREHEVTVALMEAGGHFEKGMCYDYLSDPNQLNYVCDGKVISVSEYSEHGKLLKATCDEVFLPPKWATPLTESEKALVEKIGDYIKENYGEVGIEIGYKIKSMPNFCKCTECKHFAIYCDDYDKYDPKPYIHRHVICEKAKKELSHEEADGSVGTCCNYEPI